MLGDRQTCNDRQVPTTRTILNDVMPMPSQQFIIIPPGDGYEDLDGDKNLRSGSRQRDFVLGKIIRRNTQGRRKRTQTAWVLRGTKVPVPGKRTREAWQDYSGTPYSVQDTLTSSANPNSATCSAQQLNSQATLIISLARIALPRG